MNGIYFWLWMLIPCLGCRHTSSDGQETELLSKTAANDAGDPCRRDTLYFDKYLEDCLHNHNGHTTIGMTDCFEQAAIHLDAILDHTYKELYAKLDTVDRQHLDRSQVHWQQYRESESAFYTVLLYLG